jgi:hypothetical protein
MADKSQNSSSVIYEASRVVKNTPGVLFGLTGYNSKTAEQFIQLHDDTVTPAEAAVPVVVFKVAASSPFALDFGVRGRTFTKGIVLVNSSTGPTKTIGSADCWFDAQYV